MGGAACIFYFLGGIFMRKTEFFIYNKEHFSVAIKRGDRIIDEKTFSLDNTDEIARYLVRNGAILQQRGEDYYLFGGIYTFGNPFELYTESGEKLNLIYSACDYLFYAHSGFIKGVEINNLKPVYDAVGIKDVKSARDIITVWDYLQDQNSTAEFINSLVSDSFSLLGKEYFECKTEFDWAIFRLANNLRLIYETEGEKGELNNLKKILTQFLQVVKSNTDEQKNLSYYGVFQLVERWLIKKETNLLRLLGKENEQDLTEQFYSKVICTAIFWVIDDKKIIHALWLPKSAYNNKKGRINCELSHYNFWRRYVKDYPEADFATYPRGRIMYDLESDENVIFYDECITGEQLKELLDLLQIKRFHIEYDEHYSCDKCVGKKNIF